MTNETKNSSVDVLDAVYHEAGLVEGARKISTPREKRIAERVKTRIELRLAEMRRNLLPAVAPPAKLKPIRPSLLQLARDALVAKLEEIQLANRGAVQYAHCDLRGLSDDDLRRIIELLEPDASDLG